MTDPRLEKAADRSQPVRDDYERMMLLERLESLVEEMDETGVADRAAAERFDAILAEMDELGILNRAEAAARVAALLAQLDESF